MSILTSREKHIWITRQRAYRKMQENLSNHIEFGSAYDEDISKKICGVLAGLSILYSESNSNIPLVCAITAFSFLGARKIALIGLKKDLNTLPETVAKKIAKAVLIEEGYPLSLFHLTLGPLAFFNAEIFLNQFSFSKIAVFMGTTIFSWTCGIVYGCSKSQRAYQLAAKKGLFITKFI